MFQSIKQLIFANTTLYQAEGVEVILGVIPEAFERPVVLEGVEHAVGSSTISMNQPPTVGQAGPSRPPKGAQVLGLFTTE